MRHEEPGTAKKEKRAASASPRWGSNTSPTEERCVQLPRFLSGHGRQQSPREGLRGAVPRAQCSLRIALPAAARSLWVSSEGSWGRSNPPAVVSSPRPRGHGAAVWVHGSPRAAGAGRGCAALDEPCGAQVEPGSERGAGRRLGAGGMRGKVVARDRSPAGGLRMERGVARGRGETQKYLGEGERQAPVLLAEASSQTLAINNSLPPRRGNLFKLRVRDPRSRCFRAAGVTERVPEAGTRPRAA